MSRWPFLLIALFFVIALLPVQATDLLEFNRTAIDAGQYWRLLTANFTHLGWPHTLLNAAGVLLIAWLYPRGHAALWLGQFVLVSLLIGLGLYLFNPVQYYVGASGTLHGSLMLAALHSRWLPRWRQWVFVGMVVTKLIWEQTPWYDDADVYALIGGHVMTMAHFIGGFASLALAGLWWLYRRYQSG